MRLLEESGSEVHVEGLCARQSRLGGAIGDLVLASVLAGAPLLWWSLGAPWPVWGLCVLLAVLVVPGILGDLVGRFSAANWIVQIRSDGLWINLRSYRNRHFEDACTVAHLQFREVASARQLVETYSTPSGRGAGSTSWRLQSLELLLRHGETRELADALDADRRRGGRPRTYLGFITVERRARHFPVSLPSRDVVRIAWRGARGNDVTPDLGHFLEELGRRVSIATEVRRDRDNWQRLGEEEVVELVDDLATSGQTMDAARLLVRRLDYSPTEARRRVRELARSSHRSPAGTP